MARSYTGLSSSRYIAAADLNGQEMEREIVRVEVHPFDERDREGRAYTDHRPVLYFTEAEGAKGLKCNRINGDLVADALGDDLDSWPGHKIVLYPSTTEFRGKQVPCVRVRMAESSGPPAGQDDIPF